MIIAVDFDGTIVEHKYPAIGKELPYAIKTLKLFQEKGHKLILWTYRSGQELEKAVQFCHERDLTFHAVNCNFEEEVFDNTFSRKIYADLYIDDRNILGIPEWEKFYKMISEGKPMDPKSENNFPKMKKRRFKFGSIAFLK